MQGRAAGRGGAPSAAARVAGLGRGGLGWSRRGGTPDTRSSAGARARAWQGCGGGARGLEWLVAETRSPRLCRRGGGGGGGGRGWGTSLFRRETTLRFCSTTGLPGSPPPLGPVFRAWRLGAFKSHPKSTSESVLLRIKSHFRTRERMRRPKCGGGSGGGVGEVCSKSGRQA